MSSTTDRRAQRGQVLVIFAVGMIGILAIAALVFDIGQNLFERRKQQDAADSAALAAARWMVSPACRTAPSTANCPQAVAAALDLATSHGYAASQVSVNIPPNDEAASEFQGLPGHIQVTITSQRGSYFAGVLGLTEFRVSALAIAANLQNYPLPFSFLALNDGAGACKAGHINGNGTLTIEGDIMVSSTCTSPGALSFDGNPAVVNVSGTCSTAGTIDYGPSTTTTCGSTNEGVSPMSDPLAGLAGPDFNGSPDPVEVQGGSGTLNSGAFGGCPGSSSPATQTNPVGCTIRPQSGNPIVRIYPGVYWGGLTLSETTGGRELTVYMEPGIYIMAGGGLEIGGGLVVKTVDAGGTTFGGGILVYNTDDPGAGCPGSAYPGNPCIDAFDIQNTDGGEVRLRGYQDAVYTNMLVYQDRDASSQPAIKLTGNSQMTVEGTIYVPEANFAFSGNGGSSVLGAQIICDTFDIGGNGDLTVTYDPDDAVELNNIGLVQ